MPRKGDYEDITNHKYGNLTVLKLEKVINRRYMWLCKCDCGNKVVVSGNHLKNGHTKSCGCYNKNRIKKLNYKNGLSSTKLYYTYRNMLNRCYRCSNDMYADYGGRGIIVCDEWLGADGFINFSKWVLNNGYQEKFTIDRIDNNKGYSPNNCRWVDKYVQANNKRNNHYIKINGEIDTVGNMARKYNVSYWNLLHYSKGGKNCKYPELNIEVVNG